MRFLPLFLFFSSSVFGQANFHPEKTGLNDFIEKSPVSWAVYVNDTSSIFHDILEKQILPKYISGEIKGFAPVDNGDTAEDHLHLRNFGELVSLKYTADTVYEDGGYKIKNDFSKNVADTILTSPVFFHEIIYTEKGILKSYTSRISPWLPIYTMSGFLIGRGELVSFCLNKKYNNSISSRCIYAGRTKKMIVADSTGKAERLKEHYGMNIIDVLWPYMMKGDLPVYSAVTNESLSPGNILSGRIPGGDSISVAVDETDSVPGHYRTLYIELTARSFDRIEITQDRYYDPKKNIVLCEIPEAVLYTKTAEEALSKPLLRIVFKKD